MTATAAQPSSHAPAARPVPGRRRRHRPSPESTHRRYRDGGAVPGNRRLGRPRDGTVLSRRSADGGQEGGLTVDQFGEHLGRQVVAHALDDPQLGTGHGLGRGHAAGQGDQRIGRAVHDQRRHGHPGQAGGPVGRGEDGGQLAHRALGMVAPVEVELGPLTGAGLVEGEAGGGDDPGAGDGLLDDGLAAHGRLDQERAHGLGGRGAGGRGSAST